tara:strand:+ start:6543 stop:8408 length:1866 start_codon:yes stop_codon:yes gene_type:complete
MRREQAVRIFVGLVIACLGTGRAGAVEPCKSLSPTQVFWGDTHVHSAFSADSYLFGNLTLSPEHAYRFARGEEVTTSTGQQAQLQRPLDFLVVADHAENLGMMQGIESREPALLAIPGMKKWVETFEALGDNKGGFVHFFSKLGNPELNDAKAQQVFWDLSVKMADEANQPGTFTTLPGFEWSPTPGGNNLHRVIIFREGGGFADQVLPFATFNSEDPRDLWNYLAQYEATTGGQVFAIPHNANGSNGLMFPAESADGRPIGREYAALRAQWEPLVEVVQYKGDAEAHPLLSPQDAYADFYTWDQGNLLASAPKEPWMLRHEYARGALKLGLEIELRTGVNPYQFGMIGSTDSHTSLSSVDDNDFRGNHPGNEPQADRIAQTLIPASHEKLADIMVKDIAAAGSAAVWATENTRSAIFDALRRREVYATTGPRITLRFFGGWNFDDGSASDPLHVSRGYQHGVPMGSVMPRRSAGAGAPTFLVSAMKDPMGANLDRVQIIKGWVDQEGASQERVYDVLWSEDQALEDGELPRMPSGVVGATYRNDRGAVQLSGTWRDPDFNLQEAAFYYVRVLEIPTPNWVAHDIAQYELSAPQTTAQEHRERAYSSPIWYRPGADRLADE